MAALTSRNVDTQILRIDEAYQRLVKPAQVKKIVSDYEPIAFGKLLVGERKNQTLWVVDGFQRLTAHLEMGVKKTPVEVFVSKGRQHEAIIFKKVNADRSKVAPLDIFRACLVAKEPSVVTINSVCEECGFKIGKKGSKSAPNVISAISTINDYVFDVGGGNLLRDVLCLIKKLWSDDPDAVRNVVLGGLASFLSNYKNEDNFNYERLENVLRKETPIRMIRHTDDRTKFSLDGSSRFVYFRSCILALYNKKLSPAKRLPEIKDRKATAKNKEKSLDEIIRESSSEVTDPDQD